MTVAATPSNRFLNHEVTKGHEGLGQEVQPPPSLPSFVCLRDFVVSPLTGWTLDAYFPLSA